MQETPGSELQEPQPGPEPSRGRRCKSRSALKKSRHKRGGKWLYPVSLSARFSAAAVHQHTSGRPLGLQSDLLQVGSLQRLPRLW